MSAIRSKSDKIVSFAILTIEAQSDLATSSDLNISGLAKQAGVSRPWVYKNFGATKETILETALDIIAPAIFRVETGVDYTNSKTWLKHFKLSLEITLNEVMRHPKLFRFYYQQRVRPSRISQKLQVYEEFNIEQVVRPQIQKSFGFSRQRSLVVAEMLLTLRTGLIFRWLVGPNHSEQRRKQLLKAAWTEFGAVLKGF